MRVKNELFSFISHYNKYVIYSAREQLVSSTKKREI